MDKNEILDMELHTLSTTDKQDIECHEFDVYVEDEQGREGSYSACIVDVAERALARIEELESKLKTNTDILDDIAATLYGEGLVLHGDYQNDIVIEMDLMFNDNGWTEYEPAQEAE